jgi:hypothetical protein
MNWNLSTKLPLKPFVYLAGIILIVLGIKTASDLGMKIDTAIKVGKIL